MHRHDEVDAILNFWFGDVPGPAREEWFVKRPEFDALIRARFLGLWESAARGERANWTRSPRECLAFIVLTDQFPRNMFRGEARAFATDPMALAAARALVAGGGDTGMLPVERLFAYLPFEHSEMLADQDRSLVLFEPLAAFSETADTWPFALRHREIIERFGRFPHRNAALGRESTAEEAAFLALPGSGF
jgi:uncharacterized protein (DUF924 family)